MRRMRVLRLYRGSGSGRVSRMEMWCQVRSLSGSSSEQERIYARRSVRLGVLRLWRVGPSANGCGDI